MLIGQLPGSTAVLKIPAGFALGMTDLEVLRMTGLLIPADKHIPKNKSAPDAHASGALLILFRWHQPIPFPGL